MEALSRGAAHVSFVERAPAALSVLRGNLERLGLRAGYRIQTGGVGAFLRKLRGDGLKAFDLVFLDRLTMRSRNTRRRWDCWVARRLRCSHRRQW